LALGFLVECRGGETPERTGSMFFQAVLLSPTVIFAAY
jgi:hypothetical protein